MTTLNSKSPFRLLTSRLVYENPWLSVTEDKVIRADGGGGTFGVVEMKDGVTVLALTEDGETFLAREYRYGVERHTLELVSGAIEEGEDPLQAARRELKEEMGLTASTWTDLGHIDPFTSIVRSKNYLFLAQDLTEGARNLDSGEEIEPVRVGLDTAVKMALEGMITHGASTALILKVRLMDYMQSGD
ncbi:NUDIX domain-containing protein [Pseudofrankia asymbiotica]|uniref:NUDIX domain-containing protein n=1 Tax=Pseudofrankia asymbiotica TaxID=1834516 RepID=UPI0009771705|nr:NUDIX hydrolase [Pseudofrankia asymbiotica]